MKANRIMTLVLAAAVLAVLTSGMASAEGFSGYEDSTFYGDNTAGWREECDDTISVSQGIVMMFQNQWYNGHVSSSVDCKLVYGGGQPNACTGGDTMIKTGLNYLNYFPTSSDHHTKSSTVTTSVPGTYNLLVQHKYLYGGQWRSTDATWSMEFIV